MPYAGGLRARLIRDSVFNTIRDSLESLGWLDAETRHLPIVFRTRSVDDGESIAFNTLAVVQSDVVDEDAEMGSTATNDTWTFYVDFYAENDSVGTAVIHDVRDILRGKLPSAGRDRPSVVVMDYTLPVPEPIFSVTVENVVTDRANDFPRPWQKYWFVCRFDVVDEYYDGEA
jgi:hypothetical protein